MRDGWYHGKELFDVIVQPLGFLLENLDLVILDLGQVFEFTNLGGKCFGFLDQRSNFGLQTKQTTGVCQHVPT